MRTRNITTGGSVITPASFPQGTPYDMPNGLPGLTGNTSQGGNYYPINVNTGVPLPINTSDISGGYIIKKRSRNMPKTGRKSRSRGSGRKSRSRIYTGGNRDVIFQPGVNVVRQAEWGASDAMNTWAGKGSSINPSPVTQNYKQYNTL